MVGEQIYLVKSYKKGEEIAHSYEIPPCEDVKNVWRSLKITADTFDKFKKVVKGVQHVINELDSITNAHKERMAENSFINRLETKLTIGQNKLEAQK